MLRNPAATASDRSSEDSNSQKKLLQVRVIIDVLALKSL